MSHDELTAREDLRTRVDAALETHLAQQRGVLTTIGADSVELLDQTASMLSGGKRLRAAFAYWAWRTHGGRPDSAEAQALARIGASLELFQAAALFHDDVMDASDTRRGLPAAHRAFAARHRAAGWAGDADHFGTSAAILLGDLCLIACEEEFAAATRTFDDARAQAARAVFGLMRTEVTVGQYLDVRAQAQPLGADPHGDLERAREVIRAKSARYSVEHPIVLGTTLAGANPDQVDRMRRAGLPLGEAFQLRDDVLGVFGDPRTTGKPAGDDLREGKRTVLVSMAFLVADDAQRRLLVEHVGRPDLTDDDVALLRGVLEETGAVAEVERLITTLADEGLELLEGAGTDARAASTLADLGRAAVRRAA